MRRKNFNRNQKREFQLESEERISAFKSIRRQDFIRKFGQAVEA
jgi:hypothetical protein